MTQATPRSTNPLIASDAVEGSAVYTVEGNHIGAVERMMIEKTSGKVVYVVMSFSGFSDIGAGTYTVPWAKLRYDVTLGGYRTDITEGELRDAPGFARAGEDTPLSEAQEEELHAHFSIPPYWRSI